MCCLNTNRRALSPTPLFRPGDVAVVLQVAGEVDRGHPALPKLAVDPIALGESRREALVHFLSPLTVATQTSL